VDIPLLLAHFRVNVLLSIGFPEIDAMLRTSSKLVSLAIAALIALPAAAGDFGGRSFQRHNGFGFGHSGPSLFGHRGPSVFGHNRGWSNSPARFMGAHFAGGYDSFGRGHERNRLLKRFYSPSTSYTRNNVVIVVQPAQGAGPGGTYSGSSFAYETNGGTYIGGSGYSLYGSERAVKLAPMAKVIDVAAKGSSCSYEGGVCIIRP
jgi:hypothetical protein